MSIYTAPRDRISVVSEGEEELFVVGAKQNL
jgi:hypothetical protein